VKKQCYTVSCLVCNYISNTSESVSSGYPNTEKRVENDDAQQGIFDTIRGVWIAGETLS